MSTEHLDSDALATEEMLKMFEGIDLAEQTASDHATDNELLPSHPDEDALEALLSHDELPEVTANNTTETDILEMAVPEEEEATLLNAEAEAAEENVQETDEPHHTTLADETLEETMLATEAENLSSDAADPMEIPADHHETLPAPSPSLPQDGIAEHLQMVVANAIKALEDWLVLRQESEEKGPQQGLAQLDVLLDTVTNQQQQLAEQLNHSQQPEITQIADALGINLATPETLGWTADDWRQKAEAVAYKTDDVSVRNAKLRQQLAQI